MPSYSYKIKHTARKQTIAEEDSSELHHNWMVTISYDQEECEMGFTKYNASLPTHTNNKLVVMLWLKETQLTQPY